MRIGFFKSAPSADWSLFPSSGFERNAPLFFGLVGGANVGKYGPGLGNHCNYCDGQREASAPEGSFLRLYVEDKGALRLASAGSAPSEAAAASLPFSWARAQLSDLAALRPPAGSPAIEGCPSSARLVRIVLDNGDAVHPGCWATGAAPFYAWGGSRQSVTAAADPAKAYVEVLVRGGGGGSLTFRPREVASAFDQKRFALTDVPFACLADLMAWGNEPHQQQFPLVSSGLPIPLTVSRPAGSDAAPKVTVCHDFQGGYKDCDYTAFHLSGPSGGEKGNSAATVAAVSAAAASAASASLLRNAYSFQYWHAIDSFIYFSHSFVSPPTVEWINVCHVNGVKCLGTIITEGVQGKADCLAMLASTAAVEAVCDRLALLAKARGFEGYLINIENPIPQLFVHNLCRFVECLTAKVKAAVPRGNGIVLWYDAVTTTGVVQYQNAVTPANLTFMLKCDGIFTNYWWDPARLRTSEECLSANGHAARLADVYCGIDVFGRSTYLGGGFNTKEAARAIIAARQSIAIFAPGWAREDCRGGGHHEFLRNDFRLWEEMAGMIREAKRGGRNDAASASGGGGTLSDHLVPRQSGASAVPPPHLASSFVSLPFATSMASACGVGFAMEGSVGGASALSGAPMEGGSSLGVGSNTASLWCQQTASEGSFAFVVNATATPSDASEDAVLCRRLAVVDPSTGAALGTARAQLRGVLAAPPSVAPDAAVFQGTRSLSVTIPKRRADATPSTAAVESSPVIILLSGNAPITVDSKAAANASSLRVAVVVTAATAVDSAAYRLIVRSSTSSALQFIAPSSATECQHVSSFGEVTGWSQVRLVFDLPPLPSSSSPSLPCLPSAAIVGFGLAFEAAGAAASASGEVILGRISIGAVVSEASSPSSASAAGRHMSGCYGGLPLTADVVGVRRFCNGKGALLLSVSEAEASEAAATRDEVLGFAVRLQLCFFAAAGGAAASSPPTTQEAFAGYYSMPPRCSSADAARERSFTVAIPFDSIAPECLAVLEAPSAEDGEEGGGPPRAFLEVSVVPELAPAVSVAAGTEGAVREGFLNPSLAYLLSHRME